MDKFVTENLLLMEFLVDDLTLTKLVDNVSMKDETLVSFEFLDNTPLIVGEDDFKPVNECTNIKCGKSCLFALTPEQGNEAFHEFNIYIRVFKKFCKGVLPEKVLIGEAVLSVVEIFTELMRKALCMQAQTCAESLTDTVELRNPCGESVGRITVFVRMSCFGKYIVTQFQMDLSDRRINFKAENDQNLMYNDVQPKPGPSGEAWPNVNGWDEQPRQLYDNWQPQRPPPHHRQQLQQQQPQQQQQQQLAQPEQGRVSFASYDSVYPHTPPLSSEQTVSPCMPAYPPPPCCAKPPKPLPPPDPKKDRVVVRLGKKNKTGRGDLEMEFQTPKGLPIKPRPQFITRECMYDYRDFPEDYLVGYYGKEKYLSMLKDQLAEEQRLEGIFGVYNVGEFAGQPAGKHGVFAMIEKLEPKRPPKKPTKPKRKPRPLSGAGCVYIEKTPICTPCNPCIPCSPCGPCYPCTASSYCPSYCCN